MLTKENLLSVVSFVSGVSEDDIKSQNRARGMVLCRHAYYFIAREKMGLKLVEIGEFFGADHTTVIHGVSKIKDMMSIEDELTCDFINKLNICINEKYLIPTRIFVSIPDYLNVDKTIQEIEKLGCNVEKI